MSQTWGADEPEPEIAGPGLVGIVLILFRGIIVGGGTFTCLVLLVILRWLERPIFGESRPLTPWITQFVCRTAFIGLGIKYSISGKPMKHPGAIVANHVSWLDIFALNASQRVYFVSKSEVAKWPGIGWLARATGTVFIARKAADADRQRNLFRERLQNGHRLVFFPEGTSSDGIRVLPFKSTLFAAFFDQKLIDQMYVQPVTLIYHAPKGQDARFYGWWSDMEFGGHLLQILAARRQGRIKLVFHDPVAVADFKSRKDLARYCESNISQTLQSELPAAGKLARNLAGATPAVR